jgi:16S rRNA (guanine527-N7)-methyltransferase
LLRPFTAAALSREQLADVSNYLELLLRWNARVNLTAVRDPEPMVTRHLGESLFAAAQLLPEGDGLLHALDVGSGAGFPGLPLKIHAPGLRLTLIESRQKKAVFLKEVVRALHLRDVNVFAGRAEDFPGRADLVTLRAVERFANVLPVAASLLRAEAATPGRPSRLAILVGRGQVEQARALLPGLRWQPPIAIPQSVARVLLVGSH